MTEPMPIHHASHEAFHSTAYLDGTGASAGCGRRMLQLKMNESFFSQGSPADCIFYLRAGHVKLTVVSERGREATVTLLAAGDFIGEDSIAGAGGRRSVTASALTDCVALRIERAEMMRVLELEPTFADLFMRFLLGRSMRVQAGLVDQLFNSSEKRLARVLLMLAELDEAGPTQVPIPRITQEALAEMIGTTRSRVSYFMNRFRSRGFIEYNGHIQVNKSLLNVLLTDTAAPLLPRRPRGLSKPAVGLDKVPTA